MGTCSWQMTKIDDAHADAVMIIFKNDKRKMIMEDRLYVCAVWRKFVVVLGLGNVEENNTHPINTIPKQNNLKKKLNKKLMTRMPMQWWIFKNDKRKMIMEDVRLYVCARCLV